MESPFTWSIRKNRDLEQQKKDKQKLRWNVEIESLGC